MTGGIVCDGRHCFVRIGRIFHRLCLVLCYLPLYTAWRVGAGRAAGLVQATYQSIRVLHLPVVEILWVKCYVPKGFMAKLRR